jgi:hypothetical protein
MKNILSEHDVKGAIPSREEIEELNDREEVLREEYEEEMNKRKLRDGSFKIKASVISAVEYIKRDLDGLQTSSISYKDILTWIDRHGEKHGISHVEAETVADLLAHKYKIDVK